MDDLTLMLPKRVAVADLVARLAEVSGVDAASIVCAPEGDCGDALDDVRDRTIVLLHQYALGDYVLEAHVMLGGGRLVRRIAEWSLLTSLSTALACSFLVTGLGDGYHLFNPDGSISEVNVVAPEEYGEVGFYLRRGGAPFSA
ncbi:MAG: hypothetical protein KC668_16120 [Myxococcales bacterium]|nr:hypothetical protein [Myxococcales bacterium]